MGYSKLREVWLVALVAAVMTGCTSSGSDAQRPASSSPPSPAPSASLSDAAFHRGCDTSVSGTLFPGWKHESAISGPIAFVWLPNASLIPPGQGTDRHADVSKVLVIVKEAWQVNVSIAQADLAKASLLYDPATTSQNQSGKYRLDQGDAAVTFAACSGHQQSWAAATQFNGGVLALGPLCLHLVITGTGAGNYSKTIAAPLGRDTTCPE